jgi:hypothetical protein
MVIICDQIMGLDESSVCHQIPETDSGYPLQLAGGEHGEEM